jgi:hypothetical protein
VWVLFQELPSGSIGHCLFFFFAYLLFFFAVLLLSLATYSPHSSMLSVPVNAVTRTGLLRCTMNPSKEESAVPVVAAKVTPCGTVLASLGHDHLLTLWEIDLDADHDVSQEEGSVNFFNFNFFVSC